MQIQTEEQEQLLQKMIEQAWAPSSLTREMLLVMIERIEVTQTGENLPIDVTIYWKKKKQAKDLLPNMFSA